MKLYESSLSGITLSFQMKTIKIMMILVAVAISYSYTANAQVGINTDGSAPDASAMLDVKSTSKGFLPPRMTILERDAISTPAEGLVIYNTDNKRLDLFDGTLWRSTTGEFACGDQIEDAAGNIYNSIRIGSQCWMAENLNIGSMVNSSSNQTDNSIIEKYCYLDNTSNCDIYGGLYQWNEMMQYVTTESTQGICPTGWHLPSDEEIKTLEMELGLTQAEADATEFRGTNEGSKMAGNATLWNDGSLEADPEFGTSRFVGLPGGIRYTGGAFYNKGDLTYLWTSSKVGSVAWSRYLLFNNTKVRRITDDIEDYGFSARCVRD